MPTCLRSCFGTFWVQMTPRHPPRQLRDTARVTLCPSDSSPGRGRTRDPEQVPPAPAPRRLGWGAHGPPGPARREGTQGAGSRSSPLAASLRKSTRLPDERICRAGEHTPACRYVHNKGRRSLPTRYSGLGSRPPGPRGLSLPRRSLAAALHVQGRQGGPQSGVQSKLVKRQRSATVGTGAMSRCE